MESVRVQLEEESEARLELERQLVKTNGEVSIWRSKYESEASARAEEVCNFVQTLENYRRDLLHWISEFFHKQVEEIRRKYSARIQEQEEQIETLLVKINNLEKQKSRLQSEVEILIIDLEKVSWRGKFFSLR